MSRSDQGLSMQDLSLLLLRGILAVVFIAHGGQKLFGWFGGSGMGGMEPPEGFIGYIASLEFTLPYVEGAQKVPEPPVAAYLAACSEFIGGILLAIGLFTRLAALFICGVMVMAIVAVHAPNGFFMHMNPEQPGIEYPLTLAIVAFALVLSGGGKLTLWWMLVGRGRSRGPEDDPTLRALGETTGPPRAPMAQREEGSDI